MIKIKKRFEKFTSQDVLEYWNSKWQEKFGETYSPIGYRGNELKYIEKAIDYYGIFAILVAIDNAFERKISIKSLCDDLDSYVPFVPDYRIHFLVAHKGGKNQKQKYQEMLALDSKWSPSAGSMKREEVLLKELSSWADGIE